MYMYVEVHVVHIVPLPLPPPTQKMEGKQGQHLQWNLCTCDVCNSNIASLITRVCIYVSEKNKAVMIECRQLQTDLPNADE